MSDLSAPKTIVDATLAAFGPYIDILVNNAAIQTTRALKDITVEDYEGVYEVNVRGVILLTQAVLKHLRAPGRVINVSSVGARQGFAELSLYCGSKAALEGLTRSWAGELGGVSETLWMRIVEEPLMKY
jgi:3-oxoacyl-[acyl-carrier protein] reductase